MVEISGGLAKIKAWVTKQLHTDHQSASTESANFKDVNIADGEGYRIATEIIFRTKINSTHIGINAGRINTGAFNNFMGYKTGFYNTIGYQNNFVGTYAGYKNISGYNNNFMGYFTGYNNTTGIRNNFIGAAAGYHNIGGSFNNFMGYYAGYTNTSGRENNFVGYQCGYKNTSGHRNNFIGIYAGKNNTDGDNNTYVGYYTGYTNTTGHNNISIGAYAGRFETGDYKLFIDVLARNNEADARIKALVYGIFNATPADQLLRINGVLEISEVKSGATQALAGASVNEVWKTNGHASLPNNVLMIGV